MLVLVFSRSPFPNQQAATFELAQMSPSSSSSSSSLSGPKQWDAMRWGPLRGYQTFGSVSGFTFGSTLVGWLKLGQHTSPSVIIILLLPSAHLTSTFSSFWPKMLIASHLSVITKLFLLQLIPFLNWHWNWNWNWQVAMIKFREWENTNITQSFTCKWNYQSKKLKGNLASCLFVCLFVCVSKEFKEQVLNWIFMFVFQ